jgi:hypothetical protein
MDRFCRTIARFSSEPTTRPYVGGAPVAGGVAFYERLARETAYWRREARNGLIAYRSLFGQSLRRFAVEAEAATIPVEQIDADILLVAGGDDALWPSEASARANCRSSPRGVQSYITCPQSRCRPSNLAAGETKARSGDNDEADAALGQAAWREIARMLRFGEQHASKADH